MQQGSNRLLLASKSESRQKLLQEIGITFEVIGQEADEAACDWGMPVDRLVRAIALSKMKHACVPSGDTVGEIVFVLTADTLTRDSGGKVQGKPQTQNEAVAMIRSARGGSFVCTSFCLDRRVWDGKVWQVDKRIQREARARMEFVMPDAWIETYIARSSVLQKSNAIAIEGFGGQFLQTINGSFSTIVGLPLFELRQALEELGFFTTS